MALPDINTDNVSWIAFWNHLDNGASSITPSDATSAMDSSDSYSNGVEGIITVSFSNISNLDIAVRVKDDGWIIAWLDRTENYYSNNSLLNAKHGQQDIFGDHSGSPKGGANDIRTQFQTILERRVKELRDALSNSGASTYNASDVSHYNYLHPNATNIDFGYAANSNATQDADVSPSASTTIYGGVSYGSAAGDVANVGVDGSTLANSGETYAKDIAGDGNLASGETMVLNGFAQFEDNFRYSYYAFWG